MAGVKKSTKKSDRKKPNAKKSDAKKSDSKKSDSKVPMRPFWSGTITFGLIAVPVQLFPARRSVSDTLRMLDDDGTPLRRRYYCSKHKRLVESDEISRGFEVADGEFVLVSDEELEGLSPGKSREIDLERFVDAADIPPILFERAYFLTPAGDSNKAYRLLAEVMESTGRAGIATFVMRSREYLVAILAEDGILRAETLRFQDEVRDPGIAGTVDDPEADKAEVSRFEDEIRRHAAEGLDLDEMKDESAAALRALARKKLKKGQDIVETDGSSGADEDDDDDDDDAPPGEPRDTAREIDLLETIRISLQSGNGKHQSGNGKKQGTS